ncbi:MAG: hexose kinase [Verrucomicrobia bacterium]|nr:hexose kinase [Verrucomicrobiota bacterium]
MPSLVLALNPSIDAEWRVADVQWQEKNIVQTERRWAGGKGVNVARWLKHLGDRPQLLIPLGGSTGNELAKQLRDERIKSHIVHLREATRVNVIVTTKQGRQLRFNPVGPKLSTDEWRGIFEGVRTQLASANCLIVSGSLPRAAPVATYARLIRAAHATDRRTFLDCDGAAFGAAIRAKPFLVKPNEHELAQWYGRALNSERALLQAARALSKQIHSWVLVSRASKGACLINELEGAAFAARPPSVEAANTVGAGDAMLAAAAWQFIQGAPPRDWLRWAVATGTAATLNQAGELAKIGAIRDMAWRIAVREI